MLLNEVGYASCHLYCKSDSNLEIPDGLEKGSSTDVAANDLSSSKLQNTRLIYYQNGLLLV
jgi:hypothetical protein